MKKELIWLHQLPHTLPQDWQVEIEPLPQASYDARLRLTLHTKTHNFAVVYKQIHRKENLAQFLKQAAETDNPLLICNCLSDFLHQYCREHGINYIDEAGNVSIVDDAVYILIQGRQPDTQLPQVNTMSIGVAKCLFALFAEEELLQKTYSEIAAKAGISLGMVNKAIHYLIDNHHIPAEKQHRRLLDPKALQYQWLQAYRQTLKPKLKAMTVNTPLSWSSIALEEGELWSGEIAAYQLTKYLTPEQWLLFTRAPFQQKFRQYQARPAQDGKLTIAAPFWGESLTLNQTAQALLCTAELLTSPDSRNREVAEILNEQFLHLKQLP
ncbi:type IV toxin-antitoxin system AbiEi family antitoxin [Photobacterium sp. MCCC 1A19761]|uniref:type IV toxin-antitoxin system AbiEi family antitoxin n=1 Tax=Photobacterium sp. MCCC 1A19761 TaxID=3115000 RepID=UPI00307CE7DB